MRSAIHLFTIAIVFTAMAFGAARFNGEKGARGHRTRLAAGGNHTCALLDDGTVQCWGSNTFGESGDGTPFLEADVPATVGNLGLAVSIALGESHSCAILSAGGGVRCWGLNDSGQLGNGALGGSTPEPVTASGIVNAVALAAGRSHTCAVRVDGTVWCWGDGQPVPVQVSGLSGIVSLAAGGGHTCALRVNGTVMCWGYNGQGELGNGSVNNSVVSVPVQTAPLSNKAGVGAVELAAGDEFTCARLSDGSVSCWGNNQYFQLLGGPSPYSSVPVPIDLSITVGETRPPVAALVAGAFHACAILADGGITCWGRDEFGQVDGSLINSVFPSPEYFSGVEVAAGERHTCALDFSGKVICWGDEILPGSAGRFHSIPGINGTFLGRGITAGNQFTCGRRGTGQAACWGAGTLGQLGDSANTSSVNPAAVTAVVNAFSVGLVGLSVGNGFHACAVDSSGNAHCWGDNSRGQLGNGSFTASNHPVRVPLGGVFDGPFVAISAGDLHTCGLTVSGQVYCWGAGDRGQLGGTVDSSVPFQVPAIQNAVAVAAGNKFSCALIADGTVRCWGDNSANQLGDGGTEAFSSTPKAVLGLGNISSIAAGANHACAVSAFGTVSCWGSNARGQIGNNSKTPARFALTVSGLTDATSVSAGAFFTCVTQAGGTASCWGANDAGELAAVDSVDHLNPTPVIAAFFNIPGRGLTPLALQNVVAITTGTNTSLPTKEHACALLSTGVIRCWGDNSQGELGVGDTLNRTRPTAVNSFAANVDPAALLRNGRIAEVTTLITCNVGDDAHIIVTLEQDSASGTGQAQTRCEDRLLRVLVTIPAQGSIGFQVGAATAHVEAIVKGGGSILEDTHWTRAVLLSISQ